MPYPIALKPTSRSFNPGDYPVKAFKSQSGAERRILYGNKRTNLSLSLTYENISDANAELFIDHYDEVQGTFSTFVVASASTNDGAKTGWEGNFETIGAGASGNVYRYEGPPELTQVRPGISTVTVNLIGVL
mgnify:FL=1|tara:strand:- start:25 stop:420 length:396 start_codon:yes stop_codon:yes gene_type:complete